MRIVGIDPGLSGALALVQDGNTLLEVIPMPRMNVAFGKRGTLKGRSRVWVNAQGIDDALAAWKPDHVYIEQQHPVSYQGLTSTFSTAFNYGVLCGCLVSQRIPHTIVHARVWKPACGLEGAQKYDSVKRAAQLWPERDWVLSKDGPAEAALLGYYGYKVWKKDGQHVPQPSRPIRSAQAATH